MINSSFYNIKTIHSNLYTNTQSYLAVKTITDKTKEVHEMRKYYNEFSLEIMQSRAFCFLAISSDKIFDESRI